jgi:hypothetical protein
MAQLSVLKVTRCLLLHLGAFKGVHPAFSTALTPNCSGHDRQPRIVVGVRPLTPLEVPSHTVCRLHPDHPYSTYTGVDDDDDRFYNALIPDPSLSRRQCGYHEMPLHKLAVYPYIEIQLCAALRSSCPRDPSPPGAYADTKQIQNHPPPT